MTCENCKQTSEPLHDGRCAACLHKENTILRLLVGHVILAIEAGTVEKSPQGLTYSQQFGQAFVDHLKMATFANNSGTSGSQQNVVNNESADPQKSDEREPVTITPQDVGSLPPGTF